MAEVGYTITQIVGLYTEYDMFIAADRYRRWRSSRLQVDQHGTSSQEYVCLQSEALAIV